MSAEHQVGEILFDRFFLVRELGQGGSSQLWLAEDQNLREHVAIRVLAPALAASESVRERIRALCRETRHLSHPHILTVYDFHADADVCLISRQYVVGTELSALARRPHPEVVGALLPIVDALEYAHAQGVVHGDLKSSKVVGGAASGWRLADFGLEGALDQSPVSGDLGPGEDIVALGRMLRTLIVDTVDGKRDRAPAELVQCLAEMADPTSRSTPPDMGAVRRALEPFAAPTGILQAAVPRVAGAARADFAEIEPVSFRVDSPATGAVDRPARAQDRRAQTRWAMAAFGLVLAMALVVFFYLPEWTAERRARKTADIQANSPANAQADSVPARSEGTRDHARTVAIQPQSSTPLSEETKQLLLDVMTAEQKLRAQGVETWGGADFQSAGELRVQGENALQARDDARATELLRSSLDTLGALQRRQPEVLSATLEAAEKALAAGKQPEAARQFALALKIDPENAAAASGAARAARLDEVLSFMQTGSTAEQSGRLDEARDAYRSARDIDPRWSPASDGLVRVETELSQQAYKREMARALRAVEDGELARARGAYRAALEARPDSSEARTGLAHVERTSRAQRIGRLRRQAERAEREEDWAAAAVHYRAIVDLGGDVAFARSGSERCEERVKLEQRMAYLIDNPRALFEPATLSEAIGLVAKAERLRPSSSRLDAQRARLSRLATEASTPVRVVLESDKKTAVTVQRIGSLDTFERRELMLRPGTYVVRGVRRGYRDVRKTITVVPGRSPGTITVRCSEEI